MSSIRPVTKRAHALARWKPFADLQFAAGDAFAPLVSAEARRAALCMPVGFLDHESVLRPVAMQGLKPGKNLLVAPDGRWAVPYMPAIYRGHPFSVRQNQEGTWMFCVDEGSELISGLGGGSEPAADGQPFFDDSGEMSEGLTKILTFAKALAQHREMTRIACEFIAECDLLVPWKIPFEEGGKQNISKGLLQVDEARLRELDAETLHKLHTSGALNLLFCHLVSVPQVAVLQRFNKLQSNIFNPETDSVDELLGLPDADVIEFGF